MRTTAAWITAAVTIGLGGTALAGPKSAGDTDDIAGALDESGEPTEPTPPSQHLVFFDFDSAVLDVPARQELEVAIRWLREDPARHLVIEGHTAGERNNKKLAIARAKAARDYLVSRGVRPEQVSARGSADDVDPEDGDGRVLAILTFAQRERPALDAEPTSVTGTRTVSKVEQIGLTETTVEIEGPPLFGVMVGGGVFEFADADARFFAQTGGAWTARLMILPASLLSAEISYIGSAQEIDALGLDTDAALIGTGAEASLRLNAVGNGEINSYAFIGVGYTRFSIENASFNNSSLLDSDGVLTVPAGVGLSLPIIPEMVLDIRGMYRAAFGEELIVPDDPDAEANDLDNWSALAQVGFLF